MQAGNGTASRELKVQLERMEDFQSYLVDNLRDRILGCVQAPQLRRQQLAWYEQFRKERYSGLTLEELKVEPLAEQEARELGLDLQRPPTGDKRQS